MNDLRVIKDFIFMRVKIYYYQQLHFTLLNQYGGPVCHHWPAVPDFCDVARGTSLQGGSTLGQKRDVTTISMSNDRGI